MRRINTVIEVVHEKVTKEDWDNVLILGGDEGIGKTTLALHILEIWYTLLGHKIKPEHIEKVALGLKQFLKAFKELKRFELVVYDEAGELSSLRMMNKFNYSITKAYEVVRGANLFTILVLPDVFYVNPFFSTRRARGYIHVYKRGRFAYWNKKRLRNLIEKNKLFKKKAVWRIKPLFYDTFPKYKGVLLESYLEKKEKKMATIREELYDSLMEKEGEKYDFLKYVYNAYTTVGATKTGAIFECSRRTIYRKKDEYLEIQKQAI